MEDAKVEEAQCYPCVRCAMKSVRKTTHSILACQTVCSCTCAQEHALYSSMVRKLKLSSWLQSSNYHGTRPIRRRKKKKKKSARNNVLGMSCAKYCTHKYEGQYSTHRAWNALLTLKSHTATYTIYNHVLSLVKQQLWNVLRVRKDQSDHQSFSIIVGRSGSLFTFESIESGTTTDAVDDLENTTKKQSPLRSKNKW